jgi:hypothetical protein
MSYSSHHIIEKIKTHKKAIIIFAFIAGILAIIYSLILPEMINLDKYRPEILKIAHEKINGDIELGKLDLDLPLTGGIVINTEYLKLAKPSGEQAVSGKNISLKIAIIPLLFHDVVIKDLRASNLEATVTREDEFQFDLEKILPEEEAEKDEFKIKFRGTKATVENYRVLLRDVFVKPNKEFVLEGNTFKLLNFTEDRIIKFKTEGKLNDTTRYNIFAVYRLPYQKEFFNNRFRAKGSIANLIIEDFIPYLPYKDMSGIMSTDFNLRQKKGKLKIFSKSTVNKQIVVPKYDLKLKNGFLQIKGSLTKKKLVIDEIINTANDVNATITGDISNWMSKDPILNLGVQLNKTDIKEMFGTIPTVEASRELLYLIRDYEIEGITNASLKIKGTLNDPQYFGKIILEKYSLKFAEKVVVKNIRSILELKGTVITLKNMLIPLSGSDLIQVNGNFNLKKEEFKDFKISSTSVDLENAKKFLIEVLPLIDMPTAMLKNATVKGTTKLNLELDGKLEKPFVSGHTSFDVSFLSLKGFQEPITDLKGKLLFKKDEMRIETLTLTLTKNVKLNIDGLINIHKEVVEALNIKGNNIPLKQAHNIAIAAGPYFDLPVSGLRTVEIKGTANIDATLKGPYDNLQPYGKATLSNADLKLLETNLLVENISGPLSFDKLITLQNLKATVENNPVTISGTLSLKGPGKIKASLNEFKLKDVKTLAFETNILQGADLELLKQADISGSVSGEITLISDQNFDITPELDITINKSTLKHPDLPDIVDISQGKIVMAGGGINVENLILTTGESTFTISGNLHDLAQGMPSYSLEASSQHISLDLLRKFSASKEAPQSLRELITKIEKTTGNVGVNFRARNQDFEIVATLDNLAVYTSMLEKPIENMNGRLVLSKQMISLEHVTVNYGTTGVKIDGDINNLTTNPYINISIDGQFSPIDFTEFYTPEVREKLVFSHPVEFKGFARGNLNNWGLEFESSIPPDAEIAYEGLFSKPENTPIRLVIDGTGTRTSVNIDKILFKLGESQFNAEGSLAYSEEHLLAFDDLHIEIPSINLSEFNDFLAEGLLTDNLTGNVKTDLKITGSIFNPDILGFINLSNVSLPMLNAKDIDLDLELKGEEADINKAHINYNNIIFEISTHISNFKRIPLELTNLSVYSPSLRLTDLVASASTEGQKIESLPIIVTSGYIKIDDAIIDKLITTNLTGTIALCPNGLLQINNMSFNTAGGTAKGNIYVNILQEKLGAQLEIMGVKANAAATVLLDLPNEIFGDLNATIVFDSTGTEYEEILANAEADASLYIYNGRFTRLGTLEHLLTATNIITGGIGGINLNNILASIIPMHTGNFELLSGDFTVNEGILHTDNLITRGKNLSLEIKGDYNIAAETADMTVIGNLSKNVSGLLGPLGRLNINTLTDFIPGLGFIPGVSKKKGLLDYIPGLSFIPFFGGPSKDEKIRQFMVDMEGPLYDMSSVKNFRWTK